MIREEKRDVFRFLKKLFVLVVLFFLIDRGIGALIRYAYENYPTPDAKAFAHVIKNPSEDIFIFGSSRAVHGYIPAVLSDSTGLSCFNAGHEQTNILYADVMLNAMLKKYTPKIIVFDLNAKESALHSMEGSRLILASLMMPYLDTDTSFEHVAEKLFPKEMLVSKFSVLQEYNSQLLPLIINMHKTADNRIAQNGYIPVYPNNISGDLPKFTDISETYDSTAKNYFEDFIQAAVSRHIKLYIVQSPYYVEKFTISPSLQQLLPVLEKYDVSYLDYSFDTAFFKKEYFYDNVHLNDTGAKVFSKRIASDIKKDLEKNDPELLRN